MVLRDIWTPEGSTYAPPTYGGLSRETGDAYTIHTFHFHDKVSGRRSVTKIPAGPETSQAHIEDMAANALENWLLEVKAKTAGKHTPSHAERLQVGEALREFRKYAEKRRESQTGKVYF